MKNGLQKYLNANQYKTSNTSVLMEVLSSEILPGILPVNMTLTDVFNPWLLQAGHPILEVGILESGKLSVIVDSLTKYPLNPYDYRWNIPFSYRTKLG